MALTFDDGPTPGATEPILEVLADHNIKATFYLTEDNTGPAGCPLIRRLLREGHMIAHHRSVAASSVTRTDADTSTGAASRTRSSTCHRRTFAGRWNRRWPGSPRAASTR